MKLISTSLRPVYRAVFPFVCCAFMGGFLYADWVGGAPLSKWLYSIGFAAFVAIVWRVAMSGPDSEVFDCGDHLLVRQNGQDAVVPLADISIVRFIMRPRPARVTVRLDKPGPLGWEFSFMPPLDKWYPLDPRNSVADDLQSRAIRARESRA